MLGQTIAPLPDSPSVDNGPTLPDSLRTREKEFILFQNHYNLQSREQFEKKAAKPDPMTGKPGIKYTERYFEKTEAFTNEILDEFLYEKYRSFYDSVTEGHGEHREEAQP